jgi:replication factor C subunit 3/5
MLWVDKHRPKKIDDLSYHNDVTERLRALVCNPSTMPHLFFYGPSGSGKKTRIASVLREIYGPGAEKLKLDKRTFTTPTKRIIEINLITSNYHIELSPGDAGLNDRFVVQEVVKEMAANKNIISATSLLGEGDTMTTRPTKNKADFKTVVLMDCDQLSRQAQAALRRTMEKYATSCRLILCCNSQSKVIEPVRSRCLGIRIGAPTVDEVCVAYAKIRRFRIL